MLYVCKQIVFLFMNRNYILYLHIIIKGHQLRFLYVSKKQNKVEWVSLLKKTKKWRDKILC